MSDYQKEVIPEVKEENVLICERCGKELGFVLYFKEIDVTEGEGKPDTCWLLCHECRGVSN